MRIHVQRFTNNIKCTNHDARLLFLLCGLQSLSDSIITTHTTDLQSKFMPKGLQLPYFIITGLH